MRTADETVVATWSLYRNLTAEGSGETLARWHYWRWRVGPYFQLLTGHGWPLEPWRQETPAALAQRLLVAAMAALVVWQVQAAAAPAAQATQRLLLRLSGRQVRRGQVTAPALLAGMWVLLAAVPALEQYRVDDLKRLARLAVPGFT